MAARTPWDEEWEAPSGSAPAPRDRGVSLKAVLARALCAAGGRRGPRSRARLWPSDYRRVVVKVRVVQVGKESGRKAAALHLTYLEREGVGDDGRAAGALW
jgi:hypothetical protein